MLNNLLSRTVTGAEIRLFTYSHLIVFLLFFGRFIHKASETHIKVLNDV